MNWTLFRNTIMAAGALLVVVSCGGGGGSVASGGTGGTGISSGAVTGFGSVFVNGVEFDTTNSTVTLNGSPGPDESIYPYHRGLKVGMVVKVDGEFDNDGIHGTAMEIEYKDNLEGPIDSITGTTTRTAVILGQTVIMDSQTMVEPPATLDTLKQGDFVEVSGLVDDAGQIRATYVEVKTPGVMEVKGTIKSLDTMAKTFQINALTVDYSQTTNLPSDPLDNGQYVEVKGTSYSGSTLTATEVEIDDDTLGATDAGKVEMEGFITDVTSTQFKVGTQAVQTTGSTVFENGTASNIVKGSKVEVEGPLAGGVLTATKVSFH